MATLAGIFITFAAIWLLIRTLGDRPTTYEGKPIEYWSEQLTNQDAGAREHAAGVVNSRIIPQLTREMFSATNDSVLRIAIIDQLNQLPGVHIFFVPAEGRRAAAALDLASLGPAAKPAMPAFLKVLQGQDDPVRGPAIKALVELQANPDVLIPLLLQCLSQPQGGSRDEAADALAEFGQRSKAAVPILIKLLDDRSDKELMQAVRRALKKIDPEAAAAAGLK